MKIFLKILGIILAIFIFHSITTVTVHAVTFTYPNYDVNVQISKDSTYVVTEKADYVLNGEAHGLRRDLTLYDSQKSQKCASSSDLTCGGFDRVQVLSVTDNTGRELNSNEFKFYEYTDDYGTRYGRFEWTIWPDGKEVTDYKVGWTIQYKIFGGIQKIGNNPYFYWNMLPEDRSGTVNNAKLEVNFPSGINVNKDNLSVYADDSYRIQPTSGGFIFTLSSLPDYSNFTVAYKFQPTDIVLPGSISYKVDAPLYGINILLDQQSIDSNSSVGIIKSVEAGDHTLEINHVGYKPFSQNINVKSGETSDVEVTLVPETWMSILLVLNNVFILIGCILVPVTMILVYLYYRRHGRDKNMPKTIIPLYTPPENTPPYLLGTIKDESVDKEDIVGSIIDLAYRGFIKIKELKKGKNYELNLQDKDTSELNETEKQILDSLFNGEDTRETDDMSSYFPSKYIKLTNRIYDEVVEKGFFSRSPRTTIGIYAGIGVLLIVLGVGSVILLSALLTNFLGYISIFTIGIAAATGGFCLLVIAKFMPAKTSLGSKTYADILGFKMYLHTAERYRLQKLGPDEFERYLSYAVVFKIEKEWAKKFEGIYNKQPDWFEGDYNVWNAIIISNFLSSFRTASVSGMTPVSSASGGGWSGGGGSFGGFSGGGGGGGGSGGW